MIVTRDLNAMGDAIFLGKAPRIDETLRQFALICRKTKPEIDPRVGGGLNLREDMITVEWNHRFAGAGLDVRAERPAESKKLLEDAPQRRFFPEYCSSTYSAAVARYFSGESPSPPFPSARSAIHHAKLVASLCLDFSQARRAWYSLGPSALTSNPLLKRATGLGL